GDFAVACARGYDQPASAAGGCWSFGRNIGGTSKWGVIDPLVPTAALVASDAFGTVASMSTSYVAIGSASANTNAGRVWIFGVNKNGVGKFGAITVKNGAGSDLFGTSVSVSGTYIAVGTGKANSGSVTIYEASQGGAEAFGVVKTVVSPVPLTNENFGAACHLNIPYLVVGSPFSSSVSSVTSNAWLFSQNNGGSNQFGNVSMLSTSFISQT
ncbi:hypothetical protein, partial [Pseudomonas brenneri]|uniref:hypothetical protein n=1 Tax=Pseudomonas brenneri TaxID=129817 RepID=UPI00167712E4